MSVSEYDKKPLECLQNSEKDESLKGGAEIRTADLPIAEPMQKPLDHGDP